MVGAPKRRCPDAGLLHHSDQGCTYASEDYQRMLVHTCPQLERAACVTGRTSHRARHVASMRHHGVPLRIPYAGLCTRHGRAPLRPFDTVSMANEENDEVARVLECQMCHQPMPSRQLVVMGGRRLCLGCASAWFDDDDDAEKEPPTRRER